MDAKVLSTILEITPRYADYLLSGKKTASKKKAVEWEKKTGVDRRAWAWPEDFKNPLLQRDDSQVSPPPSVGTG